MTRKTIVKMTAKINMELLKNTMQKLIVSNEFEKILYDKLEAIRKKVKKGEITTKYDRARTIKDNQYGRMYPIDGDIDNYCCTEFSIRSYFAREYYKYIDLSCCHANILRDLANHYSIPSKDITAYCANRKHFFDTYGMDKQTINEQCNYEMCYVKDEFAKNIFEMIYSKNGIVSRLKTEEFFTPLWLDIKAKESKHTDPKKIYNANGKFIALVCQTYECLITERAITFLEERGMIPNAYIYDGLLFKKEYDLDLKSINEFLTTEYLGVKLFPIFKLEEFEIADQYLKIFGREIQNDGPAEEDELPSGDLTDHVIAQYIFNENVKKLINNQGIIYAYYLNEWTEDLTYAFKGWLSDCTLNIVTNPKKLPSLVQDRTKSWPHYITQLICMCDKLDIVDILDKETGIIPFNDGFYNLKTKVFTKYDSSIICYFTYKVKRNFPINISKVDEVRGILKVIFNGDSVSMNEVFSFWARCIGKHTTDKLALLLVGARNSSKGLLIQALEAAFKGSVGNLLSGDLVTKKGSYESAERKNGCLAPMCNNLLCFSQEVNPKLPFDGTLWRTMVSGGDLTTYRTAYGKLTEKPIRAGLTFTSNFVINFDLSKSSETLLVYNMPCQFVESMPEDNFDRGYEIKLADPLIKEKLVTPDYLDALTFILFEHYTIAKPKYETLKENSRIITEVEEEDMDAGNALGNAIHRLYIVNTLATSDISQSSVHKSVKIYSPSSTPAQIMQYLQNKGIKLVMIRGSRLYRGLVIKEEKNE